VPVRAHSEFGRQPPSRFFSGSSQLGAHPDRCWLSEKDDISETHLTELNRWEFSGQGALGGKARKQLGARLGPAQLSGQFGSRSAPPLAHTGQVLACLDLEAVSCCFPQEWGFPGDCPCATQTAADPSARPAFQLGDSEGTPGLGPRATE